MADLIGFIGLGNMGGPMARNVGDLALLLSVLAGPDPRAPLALGDPGSSFASLLPRSLAGLRVALTVDLGGAFEVDDEVASIVSSAASLFDRVSHAHPDLAEADDTFRTLRAWHFQAKLGPPLAQHPTSFKPSLEANIRAGESLTGADVARAYTQRTSLSDLTYETLKERILDRKLAPGERLNIDALTRSLGVSSSHEYSFPSGMRTWPRMLPVSSSASM